MFQMGRIDFQTEHTSKVRELCLKQIITNTCRYSAHLSLCKDPRSLFVISIQRDQLILRKLKKGGINPAAAIIVCSYFSHLRFFFLSLTFLNANQLNFSLLGVGYHAFLFVQKPYDTHYPSK